MRGFQMSGIHKMEHLGTSTHEACVCILKRHLLAELSTAYHVFLSLSLYITVPRFHNSVFTPPTSICWPNFGWAAAVATTKLDWARTANLLVLDETPPAWKPDGSPPIPTLRPEAVFCSLTQNPVALVHAEPFEALSIESSERKNDLAGSARAAMVATGSWVVYRPVGLCFALCCLVLGSCSHGSWTLLLKICRNHILMRHLCRNYTR